MKFLNFLLFLWVIFALLDPDPGTPLNPDPQRRKAGDEKGTCCLEDGIPVEGERILRPDYNVWTLVLCAPAVLQLGQNIFPQK
jgi:hypothetical protein